MERIYLELKPVDFFGVPSGYYHLYIVKREVTDTTNFNDLAWRQSGQVLRGGTTASGSGPLLIQTGALRDSKVEIPVATSARCGIRSISRPINWYDGREGAFSGMDRVGHPSRAVLW